ncbi:deoxyadenosine/deoxycytidine kinase [Metamycoplasma subdolum]|uniref:Deoxyadenosine/deoxycytidine kinase n=1 Tax=Metamycoplasma subdolum TaxID=92407 RepID=A0A3M0A9E3_9BACT|nr:deoxynucleoside kinase [Metamycoplasma subdolum]RMA79025.1 deoxyadenosine/deoxycytidine kinase [Metamycoplasma subdolum]WPB50548.1 deoxynucleoside kinase [Metamycoplasma subdolum]
MVIGISGMIGSGKTTLSKGLHKHYEDSIFLEEFKKDDPVFNTFLRWFYENQPNINIAFQSFILESLSDNFVKTVKKFKEDGKTFKKHHIFLDRFNLEHFVFGIVNLKGQKPEKYLEGYAAMFKELILPEENPDLAIYIDVDYDTFKRRIFERGRESEVDNFDQNEEYFKLLHSLYKKLYIELVEEFKIPYVIIDSNHKTGKKVLEEAIQIIDNFDFSKSKRWNK